ncbi:MAG TPA: integrase core domain-containing protein [Dehalococcoidia bacterium]|nr:integrase core domain-containing protein [Dehalococcoidia bacterium]
MPWEVTGPVKERQRLVQAFVTGRYTVTELAEDFGVSRKTAHKWLRRFAESGPVGLANRPHSAHSHPNATPDDVVSAIIRKKLAHPTWGPLKLLPTAADTPEVANAWPAPSTRGAILARAGLTKLRRRRRRVPPTSQPFSACDRPNSVWCADFKGWFRTQDGQRCDPLTVSDAYSRMLLCCQIVPGQAYAHVRPAFEVVFREYGLPDAIRTDNGSPFASVAVGGLSRLAVWWVKLGIWQERIDAGHPEQNGRHERMHLTLKQECCHPPAATPAAQQLRLDGFRVTFNNDRPHQAIGLQPPAAFYRPSPRSYPVRLEDPVYAADAVIRRVRSNGEIRWKGNLLFLCEALIGEAVGISETLVGYEVHFGPIALGKLDLKGERLIRPGGRNRNADL